ncbi:TetR/AcrR family transcriptional regulator [Microbacterium sp.]|uniref:TetR/AcrR family transcriptional regulator n=1 Tax=Microbacterium sp. TaxID=51671 RepID=UPI0028125789|nr:TetR/AcrR family transcriptional regulator [Microbacterium sp.]
MESQPQRPSSLRKRAAITAAAADVFVRDGYDPASMDEIAERAGVSKQTLYAHFGSKEGLFVQVLQAETERAFASLPIHEQESASVTASSLRRHLEALGEAFLEVVLTPRMIGLRRLAIAESHRFAASAEAFARGGHERSVEALARMFRGLVERGLLAGDARRAARTFVLLVVVGPVDRAMFGSAPFAEQTRAAHIAEGVRLVLAGFGDRARNPSGDR